MNVSLARRFSAANWKASARAFLGTCFAAACFAVAAADPLLDGFRHPPESARPWTYWFWMDGNLSREGMTADLEAMKRAGLGGVIIMEVDVGVPRGPVRFMSEPWRALFKHAVEEAERLGLEITLNAGPGWTGSGGPWVKIEQSMQHIVASQTNVTGGARFDGLLPQPPPRARHFVHGAMPPEQERAKDAFYRDVAVLAFPAVTGTARITDVDEKALYYRNPFSSHPGVKPYLLAPAEFAALPAGEAVASDRIVDLSGRLEPDGRLTWDVPPGGWTILRFGRTSTGANTRPAPAPGLGLECDKFDPAALEAHFENFVGALLREVGPRPLDRTRGWTALHIDSWEMGAQNWTARFRDEFGKRRGYDPLKFLPAVTGLVVDSLEVSERFLWDLRQTAQELVIDYHAKHLKELGKRHGFRLSIEPYDMNPCADLSLGGVADVPMCEFWANGFGFDSSFSCFEAVSIAHTLGRPVVAAESFTSSSAERWQLFPRRLKDQGDWAFCTGINRLVFHRYAHQPWLDRQPGMTMGPYGVHWERTQTWWDMVPAYHLYLARCQFLLQQGTPVADICYLAPEGAPHVFRPPPSALRGSRPAQDRRGYNFDGCAPETLLAGARAQDGRLVLASGMSYRALVLPEVDTMTPELLGKIKELVEAGATVFGQPPRKSPSLAGHPECDREVRHLADELWGSAPATERVVGRGRVIRTTGRPALPAAETPPRTLPPHAKWIWHAEGNPAAAAPVTTRHFRRAIDLDPARKLEYARLIITADNSFTAAVNGKTAGEGDDFHVLYGLDVRELLRPGRNVLTVAAQNGGDTPNPAGLIAALELGYVGGPAPVLVTDKTWESALAEAGVWQPVMELGALGMSPWGRVGRAAAPVKYPELYGDYAQVATWLAGAGVPPDFEAEAEASLRYTHRRLAETDLYFVSNTGATWVNAEGRFRVTGKAPAFWDPVSGRAVAVAASEFTELNGVTSVKLALEPYGSVFVVFQAGDALRKQGIVPGSLFPVLQDLADLNGPWEVRFQPGRGAPEAVTLERLTDWSKHDDMGVRHFSGLATYRKDFVLEASQVPGLKSGGALCLDLGRVEVMARVRLNGRDLGVVWKEPYRVNLGNVAKAGLNTLEITVANLWPNRLIGDAGLPSEKRVAWTTWSPFKKDTPLLESGLLGPVKLRMEKAGAP